MLSGEDTTRCGHPCSTRKIMPSHCKQGSIASKKLALAITVVLAVVAATAAWRTSSRAPRVWAATEVPVAFWAWRTAAPTGADVERAVRETRARTLFMRAGQFDYERGEVRRIRAVEGRFPRAPELHLVYNSTRSLLAEFEKLDESQLAAKFVETFLTDDARAANDCTTVAGLQLDIDVPTRLLPRYGRVLRAVRERLPEGMRLSVTGLPTWMNSNALAGVLAAVDFWTPQFYGAEIPDRVDKRIPIASPLDVARAATRARKLDKPFYAGLPAYGHALLYSSRGDLIALRGDLDPARVADDPNFELVERRPFQTSAHADAQEAPSSSEWRYVYRALDEGVTDGLAVRAGDQLVLDVPSAASLRALARAVRENAGERLLGICIFRLPNADDPTALTFEQVAAALADDTPAMRGDVRAERFTDDPPARLRSSEGGDLAERDNSANYSERDHPANHSDARDLAERSNLAERGDLANYLAITATNRGTTDAVLGEGALAVTLRVPAGSVRGVAVLDGFASFETLCAPAAVNDDDKGASFKPCSARRANALRLKARTWRRGAIARALLSFDGEPPAVIFSTLRVQADDGETYEHQQRIAIHTVTHHAQRQLAASKH